MNNCLNGLRLDFGIAKSCLNRKKSSLLSRIIVMYLYSKYKNYKTVTSLLEQITGIKMNYNKIRKIIVNRKRTPTKTFRMI